MQFFAYVEAEFFEFFDTNAKTKAQPKQKKYREKTF